MYSLPSDLSYKHVYKDYIRTIFRRVPNSLFIVHKSVQYPQKNEYLKIIQIFYITKANVYILEEQKLKNMKSHIL